ncbi:hypothetical protein BDR22DRAFT_895239 [Usnea florida]
MAAPSLALHTPPSGGDRDRGWLLMVIGIVFNTTGTILVLARLYFRSHIKKNLGFDDLFVVLGLIFATVAVSLMCVAVHYGLGRHQFYLESSPRLSQQLPRSIELLDIAQVLVILSSMFTRVSICFFLLRIFGTVRMWKRSLHGIIAFTVAVNIATASTTLVECSPPQKAWNPLIPGTCWSDNTRLALGECNGAAAVSCDWALASLPIVFMWGMQMSIKKKLGICILMSLGFFSGICAIVRTALLKDIIDNTSSDVSWNVVPLTIWGLLETLLGIIAACIPTVKPLFDKPFRRTLNLNRKVAGERPDPIRGGDDDRCRLQPAMQPDTLLDTFPTSHIPNLGDRGREKNQVEIKAGGQGNRNLGLGREEIRMDTEFGIYRGDHEDGFDSV